MKLKYEYLSLSFISFICGLLIVEVSPMVVAIPFLFNIIWYTYSFFFIVGFVLFGLVLWYFAGVLCYGFCYAAGVIVHQNNNIVIINNIACKNKKVPQQLTLKCNPKTVNIKQGEKLNFTCYFYGKRGKLLKVYSQKYTEPSFIDRIRNYIKSRISLSSQSEFLYALLLGDRSLMANQDILRQNGIIHMLAISGLHISIILFYVRLFVRYILNLSFILSYSLNASLISNICALAIATIYAIISFSGVNILRSIIMCTLAILVPYIDSRKCLIITIFILLIYNPNYVFDCSFQMSALATFAILSSMNNIGLQQLYINTALLPFTQTISPLALGLNLIMIPLISLALLLSLFLIHSEKTLFILDYFIHFLMKIVDIQLPFINIPLNNLTKCIYFLLLSFSIFTGRMYISCLGFIVVILQKIIQ